MRKATQIVAATLTVATLSLVAAMPLGNARAQSIAEESATPLERRLMMTRTKRKLR